MEPENRFFLPIIGIAAPFFLILLFSSYIERYFRIFIPNVDPYLILILVYCIWLYWSHHEAKKQRKFFQKKADFLKKPKDRPNKRDIYQGEEKNESKTNFYRYGTSFFISSMSNFILFFIWWAFLFEYPTPSPGSATTNLWYQLGFINLWYQVVVVFALMFIGCNVFRVVASIRLFNISTVNSINSIKFILIEEFFLYGSGGLLFLYIGGFFY